MWRFWICSQWGVWLWISSFWRKPSQWHIDWRLSPLIWIYYSRLEKFSGAYRYRNNKLPISFQYHNSKLIFDEMRRQATQSSLSPNPSLKNPLDRHLRPLWRHSELSLGIMLVSTQSYRGLARRSHNCHNNAAIYQDFSSPSLHNPQNTIYHILRARIWSDRRVDSWKICRRSLHSKGLWWRSLLLPERRKPFLSLTSKKLDSATPSHAKTISSGLTTQAIIIPILDWLQLITILYLINYQYVTFSSLGADRLILHYAINVIEIMQCLAGLTRHSKFV